MIASHRVAVGRQNIVMQLGRVGYESIFGDNKNVGEPGNRPRVRWRRRSRNGVDARQNVVGRSSQRRRVRWPPEPLDGDPLPLPRRRTVHFARLSGGHGHHNRWHHHGPTPPYSRRRRCPVPPRIHPHRRRPRPAPQLPGPSRRGCVTRHWFWPDSNVGERPPVWQSRRTFEPAGPELVGALGSLDFAGVTSGSGNASGRGSADRCDHFESEGQIA